MIVHHNIHTDSDGSSSWPTKRRISGLIGGSFGGGRPLGRFLESGGLPDPCAAWLCGPYPSGSGSLVLYVCAKIQLAELPQTEAFETSSLDWSLTVGLAGRLTAAWLLAGWLTGWPVGSSLGGFRWISICNLDLNLL